MDASATKEIRAAVREILVRQAIDGPPRNRPVAAKLLGEALAQPTGYFGRPVSDHEQDQWREDQLALIEAIGRVIVDSDDPYVRLRLRGALEWHAEHSAWPEAGERAAEIRAIPMTEDEEVIAVMREPIDWLDQEASAGRVREVAARIVAAEPDPEKLMEELDARMARLETLGETSANAAPLLDALAKADVGLAVAMADWLASNPGTSLAAFGDSVLLALEEGEGLRAVLERLRDGDVAARRRLAGYLAAGRWFEEPRGPEEKMVRELVRDQDAIVVTNALTIVLRLGESEPGLAVEIGLESEIGEDPHLADRLCMALDRRLDILSEDQVKTLLGKLAPVTRLEFWPDRAVSKLIPRHGPAVVDFLLARAAAGRDFSFREEDASALEGTEDAEQATILRRVRDAGVGAKGLHRWQLNRLYWRLADQMTIALDVLAEWLVGDDDDHFAVALGFLGEMPWTAAIEHPNFVEGVLDASQGRDRMGELRDTLLTATALSGDHSRAVGEPAPRDVRLREEASTSARRFDPGSPARLFFEDLVKAADQNIKQEQLEDEEFTELP